MRSFLTFLILFLILTSTALASGPERLRIESVGLDAPVETVSYEVIDYGGGTAWRPVVPASAVGWYGSSAQPGDGGNVVLLGHSPGVLGDLWRVRIGDAVVLTRDGREHRYSVTDKLLIPDHAGLSFEQRRRNGRWISPTDDERVTLVTCWGERRRLVVVAR